jgi:hypothetical protein
MTPALALQRCFEKNPKRRWQAIGDLRVEVEQILAAPTAGAIPTARMNRVAVVIAAAAATLIAAPVTWFVKPAPLVAPRPVVRFEFELAAGQTFRNAGRPTVALSADGRHFAYNSAAGVYLRSLDTLTARVIPGTEPPMANLFFSPDGEWLAYWSVEAQALQKISIGGGAPVTIAPTRAPFGASWGRDGNILLGQSLLLAVSDAGSAGGHSTGSRRRALQR